MNGLHNRVGAALENFGITVRIHDHSAFDSAVASPNDLSKALGVPLERITKSVLLQQQSGAQFVLAVCPINRKIDMKSISRHLALGRLELASADCLTKKLGYPRLGVSPLGLPRNIVVVIDKSLLTHRTVIVGGGNAGIEVELGPWDLAQACDGEILVITDGRDST